MEFTGFFLFLLVEHTHVETVIDDEGIGFDTIHNEDIASNGAMCSDSRFTAKDCCSWVDRDMILNRGMPFDSCKLLTS